MKLGLAYSPLGLFGQNFFVDSLGWPGMLQAKKIRFFHFFPRATPGPSAS